MPYEDPAACPACRSAVRGALRDIGRCPVCGVDLTSEAIVTARRALSSADAWIAVARREAAARPAEPVIPTAHAEPDAPRTAGLPTAPPVTSAPSTTAPAAARRWTAGGVVLALGAACLVVAGLIFVGVAWGSLGAGARTGLLVLVTIAAGIAGDWCVRRRVPASATTWWTVCLGLLTIDWFVGRGLGFAGLDTVPFDVAVLAWSAAVGVVVLAVGLRSQHVLGTALGQSRVVLGLVPLPLGAALAAVVFRGVSWPFWPLMAATAAAAVVMTVGHVLRWNPTRALAAIWSSGFAAGAVVSAFVEAVAHPQLAQLGRDGHGVALLVVGAAAIAAGLLVRGADVVVDRSRTAAAVLALTAWSALVVIPVQAAHGDGPGWTVTAALVLAMVVAAAGSDGWSRGARLLAAAVAAVLLAALVPFVGVVLHVAALAADPSGPSLPVDARLGVEDPVPFAAAYLAAVGAIVLLSLLAALRWPEVRGRAAWVLPIASTLAGLLAIALVADTAARPWSLAAVLVAVGSALALRWRGRPGWSHLGVAVVTVAPAVTMASDPVWLTTALVVAVLLVTAWWHARARPVEAAVASALASWWLGIATVPLVLLLDGPYDVQALVLTSVAAALLVLATPLLRGRAGREGVEVAAVVLVLVAVLVAAARLHPSPALVALVLTIPGATATALSLLARDRRILVGVGAPLLGLAWILRLVASDVTTIEAYTAPFAAVLLVVGVVALVRRPELSTTTALGPGLTLALLPSLPAALADPTGLRAGLLALAALVALLAGLARRWRAPFAAGVVVLALLVLVNVGPYAAAVPRWVVIALVGGMLTLIGTTWESRVRDGRSAVQFVSRMR